MNQKGNDHLNPNKVRRTSQPVDGWKETGLYWFENLWGSTPAKIFFPFSERGGSCYVLTSIWSKARLLKSFSGFARMSAFSNQSVNKRPVDQVRIGIVDTSVAYLREGARHRTGWLAGWQASEQAGKLFM